MKLSKQQKEWLVRDLFYLEEDLKVIEKAISRMKFHLFAGDKDMGFINRDKAIEIIGEWGILSGCARAAFHGTAMRQSLNGNMEVLFSLK